MLPSWLRLLKEDPELAPAQVQAFLREVVLVYLTLIIIFDTLAYVHWGTVHVVLYAVVPGCLNLIGIARIVWWQIERRSLHLATESQSRRRRNTSVAISLALALGLFVWSVLLVHNSTGNARLFTAFTLWFAFHSAAVAALRFRTLLIGCTVFFAPTYAIVLFIEGDTLFRPLALLSLLITAILSTLLLWSYRDFANLIRSRINLERQSDRLLALSDENDRLANLDVLTGLSNRRRLFAELETRVATARASGLSFVVGMIDLDGFKPVNDAFGHAVGDRVLVEVAHRLEEAVNQDMFIARIGGDEFVLIADGYYADAELVRMADDICTSVRRPYELPGIVAKISCSIGFARFPETGQTAEQLFERADYALFHSKQNRRGRATIFSAHHQARLTEMARVEQALGSANLEAEMYLAFQPIFDTERQQTLAFEALARWNSPELGFVGPDKFIPVAERTSLISGLTETLLHKAVREALRWPDWVRLSFNLSARDLGDPDLAKRLSAILMAERFPADRIDFELTETASLRDPNVARDNLDALSTIGCGVALDDFGSGLSNLAYIHQLPLTKIKIDRSFIAALPTNRVSRDLIRTIVDLSRNLGCSCIVEGVETAEQLMILKTLGCRLIQGYYCGKPMSGTEALARIVGEQNLEQSVARFVRPIA